MHEYLVFRLYGPFASWGEIAVGEVRHSAAYPSRSALIGLLAAALGIHREDETEQHKLAEAYRFGVKLLADGAPLRDYHTVENPAASSHQDYYPTRRHELADPTKTSMMLTAREYRTDSLAIVAVAALPDAPYTLQMLSAALERPRLVLYLGRKSCPLAIPVQAQCIKAPSLRSALDETAFPSLAALASEKNHAAGTDGFPAWPTGQDRFLLRPSGAAHYYWDEDLARRLGHETGMNADTVLIRHDQPVSRQRWQFEPRRECLHIAEKEVE